MTDGKPAPSTKKWRGNQRFTLRASTLLLLYLLVLAAIVQSETLTGLFLRLPYGPELFQQLTASAVHCLGAAILLAACFFLWSVIKKNPQIQFLAEAGAGLVLLRLATG